MNLWCALKKQTLFKVKKCFATIFEYFFSRLFHDKETSSEALIREINKSTNVSSPSNNFSIVSVSICSFFCPRFLKISPRLVVDKQLECPIRPSCLVTTFRGPGLELTIFPDFNNMLFFPPAPKLQHN